MLLKPKNTKYKKSQKGGLTKFYPLKYIKSIRKTDTEKALRLCFVRSHIAYALLILEPGRITASQIAATSLAIKRKLQRSGKFWLRVFPHQPVTKKPAEVRMGKGKGNVDFWTSTVVEGSYFLELECNNEALALSTLKIAQSKLPVKTKIICTATNA